MNTINVTVNHTNGFDRIRPCKTLVGVFAAKFHLGTAAITNTVLRIKDPLPDRKDQKPDPL